MNQRTKTLVLWLVDPRSIILAFALFNFIFIWLKARDIAASGIACVVCPWYYPWDYFNEPSLLVIATIFLRFNRMLAYLVALLLSGYVVGYAVRLFLASSVTLLQEWRFLRKYEPYSLGSWDSQIIFGAIVFLCSFFYLTRAILGRKSLPSGGG